MLTDVLSFFAILAIWLFLAPCSPLSIWKGAACALKPKPRIAQPATKTTSEKP